MPASIRVEKPGFLSTIQDLGRPGYAHLGISAAGAADPLALRLGNLLLGNDAGAAAIEMTLVGGTLAFESHAVVALTGADFEARLEGREAPMWEAFDVRAGERLTLGTARSGVRCMVCVRGGIDAPRVLGSASTHLRSGVGGLAGRALGAGDPLQIGTASESRPGGGQRFDARAARAWYTPAAFRITPGPQLDRFVPAALARLTAAAYSVLEQSDRMGIRLAGQPVELANRTELASEGVSLGAIQVPAGGQPIILFVDHQTTGGYPKIANVCSIDLHRLGQLRPRDAIGFERLDFDRARRLQLEREAAIERLVAGWSR